MKCAIIGQTKEICPADLKLYALRDVTSTIESVPLICASIMSKKLAEGISGLVLDVKVGSGAFMKTLETARGLAQNLMAIGKSEGLRVTALLTNMDQPLGRWVGNACEVIECLDILENFNAAKRLYPDTVELTLELASHLLVLGGRPAVDRAKREAEDLLSTGQAAEQFWRMARAQGCRVSSGWRPKLHPLAVEVRAEKAGFLQSFETERIGMASVALGAGRVKTTDTVDHQVSLEVCAKIGEAVEPHSPILRLYAQDQTRLSQALAHVRGSFRVGDRPPAVAPLVLEVLSTDVTGRS
jgi:pyrimidine-nucleoside phosphorylase